MNRKKLSSKSEKAFQQRQKGQALLFVVVAMTIALAVGVSVSLRTLSSISRISSTDTYSRVLAAAEGGAEKFSLYSTPDLSSLAETCTGDYSGTPPAKCVVTFTPVAGDNITARAVLSVEAFNYNRGDHYEVSISKGEVSQVNLEGFSGDEVKICWNDNDADTNTSTDLYYVVIDDDGIFKKEGFHTPHVPTPNYITHNFTDVSSGNSAYPYCHSVDLNSANNLQYLRIMSIAGISKVGIYPSGGSLPDQGYKITSIGELVNAAAENKANVNIVVYKSFPYMPAIFDSAVYSLNSGF